MKRFLPDTLAGRTIVILFVGLGLFHLWSIWIYRIGTENLLGSTRAHDVAEHLIWAWRTLDALPPDQREPAAHALSNGGVEMHWSPISLVRRPSAGDPRTAALRERLYELAPELSAEQMRFGYADDAARDLHVLLASLQLRDGTWVTSGSEAFHPGRLPEHDVLGSLTAMAAGILVVSVLLVRSINAPLRSLAAAAERIGADIAGERAQETGPREIRRVARAFNTMQARVRRLIEDRTQTLAAISHDLKTPITRLRLRAEFLADRELRRTIDADLDEMERMVDSALAFLRGDAAHEESRIVDLRSILETICNERADAGCDVALAGTGHVALRCRPLAIKRALANLIDNAVKYGHRARVALAERTHDVVVTIEDDGPGITEEEQERVFDPFYRIEGSRSRETGGTGLGLTIARTIVCAHGGEITLRNRENEGLTVVLSLPRQSSL